jgi:hypothetical protein
VSKVIVGWKSTTCYPLPDAHPDPFSIAGSGRASWGPHELVGIDRIEALEPWPSHPHLFCQWDDKLEGIGSSALGLFAKPIKGAGAQWIERRMDDEHDGFSPPDQEWSKPIIWSRARPRIGDSERLLTFRIGARKLAVHSRNVRAVLGRTAPEIQTFLHGSEASRWLWGRGNTVMDGKPLPLLNASRLTFEYDWPDSEPPACALAMPWKLPSGAICYWGLLLREPPRMSSAVHCDEMVAQGARLLFVNETSLLGFCAQEFAS